MKKLLIFGVSIPMLFLGISFSSCNDSDDQVDPSANDSEELPEVFSKFNDNIEVYVEGNFVVIKSDGIPDHNSPYFSTSDNRYEAYNGSNQAFHLNPNRITSQNYTFRIPLNPAEASNKQATSLGAIGVAVNGVPFFNQYAGPDQPLTNEINSFDQYNGHPQQTGSYHYHIEPLYLTLEKGKASLMGFLLDGFPVYGPEENGQSVLENQLDEYHGHFGVTADYPEGIYHYHITNTDPYINGNGYFGNPGTATN
ncbi:YHYH protein [Fulvivirgaceae bacterium BMA10]|uniref:YHYH protein n=1 Tax=Splendidivirga corallicola TaxID=3051826 RepID=A0ABT8KVF8_9BACT|nr:YHYH protein [Fulvivirgaceae bacterium BMA10]